MLPDPLPGAEFGPVSWCPLHRHICREKRRASTGFVEAYPSIRGVQPGDLSTARLSCLRNITNGLLRVPLSADSSVSLPWGRGTSPRPSELPFLSNEPDGLRPRLRDSSPPKMESDRSDARPFALSPLGAGHPRDQRSRDPRPTHLNRRVSTLRTIVEGKGPTKTASRILKAIVWDIYRTGRMPTSDPDRAGHTPCAVSNEAISRASGDRRPRP